MLGIGSETVLRNARIAVFADCENLVIRTNLDADAECLGWVSDGLFFSWNPAINRLLSQWGRLVRVWGYTSAHGDEPSRQSLAEKMKRAGITSPQVFPKRKGAARKQVDIALATEATRQAHLNTFDVAVFVTGDKDFIPLLRCLKDMGKGVVLLSPPTGLSRDLAQESDEHYPLAPLLSQPLREVEVLSTRKVLHGQEFQAPQQSCTETQIEVPLLIRRSEDAPPGNRSIVLSARASANVRSVVLLGSNVRETLTERLARDLEESNCGGQMVSLLPGVEYSGLKLVVRLFAVASNSEKSWVELSAHSDSWTDRSKFFIS